MINRKLARETSTTVYYTNEIECHMKHGIVAILEEIPTMVRPLELGRQSIKMHAAVATHNDKGRISVMGRKRISNGLPTGDVVRHIGG